MTITLEMIISRIDELCAERDWSYYALTKEAHLNKNAINKIKNGKGLPSLETINKICAGFHISPGRFFSTEDERKNLGNTKEEQDLVDDCRLMPEKEQCMLLAYKQGLIDMMKKD